MKDGTLGRVNMVISMKVKQPVVLHLLAVLVWAPCGWADDPLPKHLRDAESFVQGLNLEHTSYRHGNPLMQWTVPEQSHTDCSGFMDSLLEHSYGYDRDALNRWFGVPRPTAARFHDAIVDGRGFTKISKVEDIRPGDILAVKYFVDKPNTGHVMLADGIAHHMEEIEPVQPGTQQWEIAIIDSSESGHGIADSRHKKGANGKDHQGLGTGTLRLYTLPDGTVAGFSWSTLKISKFVRPEDEHLVMGRIRPDFQP